MTVGELFQMMVGDSMIDDLAKNTKDISFHHVKESMEAVDKMRDVIREKYGYEDDEVMVSDSDVNDFYNACSAVVNSLCMYVGSEFLINGSKANILELIDESLRVILNS